MHSSGQHHIRKQGHTRRHKLQKCPLDPSHIFNEFVEQDNCRIQHCRAEAEQNADMICSPSAHSSSAYRDQKNAQRRHDKTQKFPLRHLFPEKDRAHQCDYDRRRVITECRNGYGRILIGLKQQDPVESHRYTGPCIERSPPKEAVYCGQRVRSFQRSPLIRR